jgi:hypothetical protein
LISILGLLESASSNPLDPFFEKNIFPNFEELLFGDSTANAFRPSLVKTSSQCSGMTNR